MLWFNFVPGLNFIFFCFGVWEYMIMSLKQRKINFEPRIKSNHNIYICVIFAKTYPLRFRLNTGITRVQASVAGKKPGGLASC